MASTKRPMRKSFVVHEKECEAVHIPPRVAKQIAALLASAAVLARDHGITIFGGAHSGDIRKHRYQEDRAFILATISGPFDGGDGGCDEDEDGFLRGE